MTVRQKILVVDDDPELRALLASYLNKHGYDTLVAAHANELDAQIARFSPDLLVLFASWAWTGSRKCFCLTVRVAVGVKAQQVC
jgi:DNA-binding NtrC family response regulator